MCFRTLSKSKLNDSDNICGSQAGGEGVFGQYFSDACELETLCGLVVLLVYKFKTNV